MALALIVSEIFNVEKYRDLEITVRGQPRSLKMVPFDITGYGFLLVFYGNFVPKMHHFLDIRLQKCRDLENRDRGPSRSLKMSPFDRAHMTSYKRFIATMGLSRTISEIDSDFSRKSQNFPTPLYFAPPLKWLPFELGVGAGGQK